MWQLRRERTRRAASAGGPMRRNSTSNATPPCCTCLDCDLGANSTGPLAGPALAQNSISSKKSSSKSEALPQLDLLLDGNAGSRKRAAKNRTELRQPQARAIRPRIGAFAIHFSYNLHKLMLPALSTYRPLRSLAFPGGC